MRIALVTETFPPEVNGVARTLWQLVSGLVRRGHDVEVLRPDQKQREGERPAEGWRQVLLPGLPIPVYDGLRVGMPVPRRLLHRWRDPSARPDVVHVATEGPLGLSALWAARRLGLPVSTTFHTNFHDYGPFYGFAARRIAAGYLRWFHNRAGCTLVPTDDVRRSLEDLGFERVGVVSRGVDTDLFRPDRRDPQLRRSWGAGDDDLVVAFVSRLAQEKNPDLAAAALRRVRHLRPAARCVVVGDGPARGRLEELVPEAVFCGMKQGPDLATHYASADLFLFPSVTETFGNVLLEAMASGLPTVSFDYAGAGMLVRHLYDGFKTPRGDQESFLNVVGEAASRPVAELRRMGRRAAEVAADHTWERIVERFEQELRALSPARTLDQTFPTPRAPPRPPSRPPLPADAAHPERHRPPDAPGTE